MKKILVLGGTKFFGKKAVDQLVQNGHDVTIATRGNNPHPFGDSIQHNILDARDGAHEGWENITNQKWDAVFSNILYTKEDAQLMIEKFIGLTDHFYFTSSMAVYAGEMDGFVETAFEPTEFQIDPEIEVDYGEGKRQVEQVLFTDAPFKVTSFRFPIVLDNDDYTRRLHFYVEKALHDEVIYFNTKDDKVNYVKGSTAAASIVWAIENEKEGIYNVSSIDAITIGTLMTWIEEAVKKPLHVIYKENHGEQSPFNMYSDAYLISNKIHNEGFKLEELHTWMKPLIADLVKELS